MGHQSQNPRGLLFVLVGPGGVGKNTLMNIVLKRQPCLKQLATATTRAMRDNEKQGREHDFVSPERFREMIANNELLEYQEVTPNRFYGIPHATVENQISCGQNLLADIEVLGAKEVRAAYPDDVILIFVTVPGIDLPSQLAILRERMEERHSGEVTPDDLLHFRQRLERAKTLELPFAAYCDTVIINDDIDSAANELEAYVLSKIGERRQTMKHEEVS